MFRYVLNHPAWSIIGKIFTAIGVLIGVVLGVKELFVEHHSLRVTGSIHSYRVQHGFSALEDSLVRYLYEDDLESDRDDSVFIRELEFYSRISKEYVSVDNFISSGSLIIIEMENTGNSTLSNIKVRPDYSGTYDLETSIGHLGSGGVGEIEVFDSESHIIVPDMQPGDEYRITFWTYADFIPLLNAVLEGSEDIVHVVHDDGLEKVDFEFGPYGFWTLVLKSHYVRKISILLLVLIILFLLIRIWILKERNRISVNNSSSDQ